jgi:hypothetical protein
MACAAQHEAAAKRTHMAGGKIMRRVLIAAVMSFTSVVFAYTQAHAVEDKTNPGSNCTPAVGNQPGTATWFLNASALVNGSTQNLRVDCPISKGQVGKSLLSARIWVQDGNATANVSCEVVNVRAVNGLPASAFIGPTTFSAGSNANVQQLLLAIPFSFHSGVGTLWYIGCTLPPNTRIWSYYVNESP